MISSIFRLLSLKLKIQVIFLVFFMFLKGLMELISISSIPFLILYLLNPNKIIEFLNKNNLDFFSNIVSDFNLTNILVLIILIFFFKNLIVLLMNIYEENFHYKMAVKFRSDILKHYLMLNYIDLGKNNLSLIIRNISIEVVHFVSAITNIIKITNDSIMILIFLIFLTYVSRFEFLLVFLVFSFVSLSIFIFLRKKLKYYGERQVEGRGRYLKNITDIFHLIKDIMLNNLENYFHSLFKKNLQITEKIDFYSKLVFSSTKLIFETFAVLLLCALIFINLNSDQNVDELLAYLSVVTIAIIRMLPLFNTVLSEANKLQFRFGSIKAITQILSGSKVRFGNDFISYKSSHTNTNKVKIFENLSINNLNSIILEKKILKDISLQIQKGSNIALIGSSGSGKTTFLNHLSLLYDIPKGTIFSDEKDILDNKKEWHNILSYMPQENNLINGSIIENIALGIEPNKINSSRLEKAIKISCCDEFLSQLPDNQNTILGKDGFKLSGGQMQRLCIARALYKDFQILLMDEPTSSLDKKLELSVLNQIFQEFKNEIIIISLHKLELLELFDYIVVLDQNKLFSFTKVKDINKNAELMSFLDNLKKIKNE